MNQSHPANLPSIRNGNLHANEELPRFRQSLNFPDRLRIEYTHRDGGEVRSFTPLRPFTIIGRDPRADLVLDHPDVSRRHAYFQWIDGQGFLADLKSRAGVRWAEGPRVSGWLEPGYTIGIGPFFVRYLIDDLHESTEFRPDSMLAPRGSALPGLILERGDWSPGPSQVRLLSRLSFLGGSSSSALTITDSTVSRYHAAIVQGRDGVWAIDLLSRCGLEIRGQKRSWGELRDGDTFRLGSAPAVTIHFRTESMPAILEELPGLGRHLEGYPQQVLSNIAAGELISPLERLSTRLTESGHSEGLLLLHAVQRMEMSQHRMLEQFSQIITFLFQSAGTMQQEQADLVRRELDEIRRLSDELRCLQVQTGEESSVQAEGAKESSVCKLEESPPNDRSWSAPRNQSELSPQDLHSRLSHRIANLHRERQGRWQRLVGLIDPSSTTS